MLSPLAQREPSSKRALLYSVQAQPVQITVLLWTVVQQMGRLWALALRLAQVLPPGTSVLRARAPVYAYRLERVPQPVVILALIQQQVPL